MTRATPKAGLFLLLATMGAFIVPSGEARADIAVEFSTQVGDFITIARRDPAADQSTLNRDFNDALRELGRTNADAQALFASGQKIKIVCYGSPEALEANLIPGGVFIRPPAETRGDFDANGRPRKSGTAIIAIDCPQLASTGLLNPIADIDPYSAFYLVLIHELLHAANRDRQHPPDELALYQRFVDDFVAALVRVRANPPAANLNRPGAISWIATPHPSLRGRIGERVDVTCMPLPAGFTLGTIWGTLDYTDDSPICVAAMHSGVIGPAGGTVIFEIGPALQSYRGSTQNGVTSQPYGPWLGSYRIIAGGG